MREQDRAPEIDASDPVQVMLLAFWHEARDARENEFAVGPRPNNLGAAIAGHKMQWCKEILRAWRELKTCT